MGTGTWAVQTVMDAVMTWNYDVEHPELRALYEKAATHCHGVKDYVTRDLFEGLMKAEEHHIDFLETQIDLISRVGLELYTQKHIGGLEGGES